MNIRGIEMLRKFRLLLTFSIITLIFLPIYSEAVKIATWNILNFPGTTGTSREDDFRKVIDQLDLDILVVQEMLSQAGVDQFLNNVMNYSSPGIYEAAPFFDGPDTDNALFYKKSVITLISHQQISTSLRDISECWLEIKEGPGEGTRFGIYSVHLKAGTGLDDKEQREEEANILRNHLNGLPPGSLFLICGNFNMRSSEERAFEIFTEDQADNDGRTKDPINRLGYWHDNEEFADIHTQSTRTTQFGGGDNGVLDDRFDLILIFYEFDNSNELAYKTDSYIAYGNDGKHLNKAVNEGISLAVSTDKANALHEASDHLPVIIELQPPVYTLSISTGTGGTTDPEPGTYTYDPGTEVTITAIPDSGYEFSAWSGDASGTDNPITITMDSDMSITANFVAGAAACFIATATYGSPLHPYVRILRDFRDKYLMTSKFGHMIIDLYYKYSPFVADFIARHKILKIAFRISLLPLVVFGYSMVHFGPTLTAVMLVMIFAIPIFLVTITSKNMRRIISSYYYKIFTSRM